MPCPFLRKGLLGYKCLVTKKTVKPDEMGCFDRYEECPFYRMKEIASLPPNPKANCLKCLYYSSMTKRCVKLNVKVENPSKPPCEGRLFKPVGS